ncbi:hypothetical protein FEM21_29480 [Flavobacterium seoulense]|uniref:Uncharacterized protein n=1 Tax=Flavobacterium seoulense TaxID=1492738 RepID=A0A066WSI8_9FLAO|nr:hypothetical protein FEM21_29480 [Flavobacterium seoulense]
MEQASNAPTLAGFFMDNKYIFYKKGVPRFNLNYGITLRIFPSILK